MTALAGEMDGVSDKIGATDDSDGSQVAGGVMAKQNKALADLAALGVDVDSIINKLATGIAAKGIKRISTRLQSCAYDRYGTANYWQTAFEGSGLVIITSPSAGSSTLSNSAKFIAVPDCSTDGIAYYDIAIVSSFCVQSISKTGFELKYTSSTGSQSGTLNLMITSIEFN